MMDMSIFAGLSEKASGILSYLRGAVNKGWSANKIINTARELGLPTYRRSEMLKDISVLRQEPALREGMKFVARDSTVTERLYLRSESALPQRYLTTVRLRGFDLETGETFERYVSVSHDTLKKRYELEEAAISALEEASPTLYIEEATPVFGRMRL